MQRQGFKTGRSIVAFALAGIAFVILAFYAQLGIMAFVAAGAIAGAFLTLGTHGAKNTCFSVITFAVAFALGGFLIVASLLAIFMEPNRTSIYDSFFSFYSLYVLGFTITGAIAALGTFAQPFTKRLYYGAKSLLFGSAVGGLVLGTNLLFAEPSISIVDVGIVITFVISGWQFARASNQLTEEETSLSILEAAQKLKDNPMRRRPKATTR